MRNSQNPYESNDEIIQNPYDYSNVGNQPYHRNYPSQNYKLSISPFQLEFRPLGM